MSENENMQERRQYEYKNVYCENEAKELILNKSATDILNHHNQLNFVNEYIKDYSEKLIKVFHNLIYSHVSKKAADELKQLNEIKPADEIVKRKIERILAQEYMTFQAICPQKSQALEYWICNGKGEKIIGVRADFPDITVIGKDSKKMTFAINNKGVTYYDKQN